MDKEFVGKHLSLHVGCTCPLCAPELWALGIKGSGTAFTQAAPKPESELPPLTPEKYDAQFVWDKENTNGMPDGFVPAEWFVQREAELRAALEELERVKFDLEISHASEAILKQCAATLESDRDQLKAKVERLENLDGLNFHYEDCAVLEAVEATDYVKQKIAGRIQFMTTGEKWSLYRGIAKLAARTALATEPTTDRD